MVYVYPLTIDPLNLSGKHDDDDDDVSAAAVVRRRFKQFNQVLLDLTPSQIRLLLFSVDFYLDSLTDEVLLSIPDCVTSTIDVCVSEYRSIRTILEKCLKVVSE